MADNDGEKKALSQDEFNQYLVNGLNQEFQQSRIERQNMVKKLAELESKLQAKETPRRPEPEVDDETNENLRTYISKKPAAYSRDMIDTARKQAVEDMRQVLSEYTTKQAQENKSREWWSDVWRENPDVADMQHQVIGFFQQTSPDLDDSDRVNWAIGEVRKQIQARIDWNKKHEEQQERQKRLAGGASGNVGWMRALRGVAGGNASGPAGDPTWQEPYDGKAELDQFVAEQNGLYTQKAKAARRVAIRPEAA